MSSLSGAGAWASEGEDARRDLGSRYRMLYGEELPSARSSQCLNGGVGRRRTCDRGCSEIYN